MATFTQTFQLLTAIIVVGCSQTNIHALNKDDADEAPLNDFSLPKAQSQETRAVTPPTPAFSRAPTDIVEYIHPPAPRIQALRVPTPRYAIIPHADNLFNQEKVPTFAGTVPRYSSDTQGASYSGLSLQPDQAAFLLPTYTEKTENFPSFGAGGSSQPNQPIFALPNYALGQQVPLCLLSDQSSQYTLPVFALPDYASSFRTQ